MTLREYLLFTVAYMDDVVAFSQVFRKHLEHLCTTVEHTHDAGLTMSPGKVQLALPHVKLLRHILGHGTVRPGKDKLKAILEYPLPITRKASNDFWKS